MQTETFLQIADSLPDALLMVSSDGSIRAANRRAISVLQTAGPSLVGSRIQDCFSTPSSAIEDLLRASARTRTPYFASLRSTADPPAEFRCEGSLLAPAAEGDPALVMLRLIAKQQANAQFTALNRKIDELGHEIERRQASEATLREQVRLMAFGRDIGAALVEPQRIEICLQRCAELLVEYIGAAFARIWLADEDGDELVLHASAGLYTHLDGSHSRVSFGDLKIGTIASEQRPHLTNSVIGDSRINDQEWARREGMVAFAGYPLVVDGRTVGVMAVFARRELSQYAMDAMASVANEIALGTERRRVEAELARTVSALREADRRKDEFLAMLAHELRNPLAPVRSGLELLAIEGQGGETVGLMQQQVTQLVRLVDDLLDVSRIMRGQIQLRRERIPLGSVIQRSIETAQPLIEAHRHTLDYTPSTEELWIDADDVRLTQVITNLLTNAAKYTPDGGHIRVEVEPTPDRVAVKVCDDGIGIAAEFLPVVFELFCQANRTLDRSEGGLGIGLTVVERLVHMHGGDISVHSEGLGQGSQFVVRLPVVAAPEASGVTTRKTPPAAADLSFRVLVVDDTVASAKILRQIMNACWSHKVVLAHDGPSACAMAESFRPDVIFLDIGLPGMDGYEVSRHLRSQPQFANTRIIAVTGYGSESDRARSSQAGIDQHLVKPVSVEQLRTIFADLPTPAS